MDTINRFLLRHEVDVARCLAAVLFISFLEHAYSSLFGMLTFNRFLAGSGAGLFAGILFAMGLFAVIELVFAIALWKHMPIARGLVVVICWIAFGGLLLASIVGPFVDEYRIALSGFHMTNPPIWFRVFAPLSGVPLVLLLLAAVDCPATRQKFKKA
jgi:MFS family permease